MMKLAAMGAAASLLALALPATPAFAAMGACEGAYVKSSPEDQIRLYSICLDGLDEDSFAGTYHNRGVAYLQTGELERAMSDFDSSILWDGDYGLAYFNRATIYAEQGNIERAIADLSRALSLRPSRIHREAYMRRGMLEEARGAHAAALANYEAIAELPIPWFGGAERTEKKRYRALALAAHARVLATAPDDSLRNGQRALELAQASLAVEDSASGRAALAAAYAELGQMDRALEEQILASNARADSGMDEALFAAQLAAFQEGRPYRDQATSCVSGSDAECLQIAWNPERMRLYMAKISASDGFAYGDPDGIAPF